MHSNGPSSPSTLPLRAVARSGALYVALQPIIDLQHGGIFGQEVLIRGSAPGFATPAEILRSAIDQAYMGELGRDIRRMAVIAAPEERLFLNIHPSEFGEGWMVRPDDAMFSHENEVYLEITESVPISHFSYCHSILREVRARGVMLVVDDLGAGYSNLKYIADLAPEIVKLDREMIARLDRDERLRKLLRSVVRMCEDMGARVVAEGIETADELRIVVESGAHFGQGYHIARPAAPAPVIDWAALAPAGVPDPNRRRGPHPVRPPFGRGEELPLPAAGGPLPRSRG